MMNIKWFNDKNDSIETELIDVKIRKNNIIEISIKTDYNTFENILQNNIFHLSEDSIVNRSRKFFIVSKAIEMDLRLSPTIFEILKGSIEISEEGLKESLINKSNNMILSENSWYALNAKQEEELPTELKSLGSVKTGFSTTWNEKI